MSFEHLLRRQGIHTDAVVPDDWPEVDRESVPNKHRPRFERLLAAAEDYVSYDESSAVIAKRHRISERELCRRVINAMQVHPDGLLVGEPARHHCPGSQLTP